MRIVGTIEARMGSSRLPGKTLTEVYGGRPLLGLVCERFRRCRNLDEVVVATTVEERDAPIVRWCGDNGVRCHRGPEMDVLTRVLGAAAASNADAIVQMGADSAYLAFDVIDELVGLFRGGDYDYVCNDLVLTYPIGIYGHVVRVSTLAALDRRGDLSEREREDVVRPIFEHPGEYRVLNVEAPPALRFPQIRLTIDYPEDMEAARAIYRTFGRTDFTSRDLVGLYARAPHLFVTADRFRQVSAPWVKEGAGG